ncbi:hypothetical protein HY379_02235 [Candidatus Saccharibacteria bacterium]|nr:hypothetical protein [Candidatus Saccharibacteria bacterium]
MVRARNKKVSERLAAALTVLFLLVFPKVVSAQVTSPNYQSNEFFFGTGGDVELSSPNYKAQGSAGALGVGNVSSANYQAFSGFLTPNEPFLEMSVNTSLVDLGTLDTATTKTGTATFQVRAYINSGYTVKTMSQPPQIPSTSATLAPMTTQAASVVGTEQFGINLKANTSPATFGSDPSPQPNSTFATGQAATGYETTNLYKYGVGDTIAQTGSSGWGLTIFTISYIANIAPLTEAGLYTMPHDLVVIATY